ncbi:hypothetical protein M2447_002438 [Ereboglobus sp. PH5-10]|uniref:hypothetical protein n=1 Tax=Ereboglobus sp. PH5-10 TaxID=2940629 RepID=UPI0024052D11|nr:hypothetical protein [Ereboglobus sp. PH5-10]MDF9828320.1 hypothetical protein [Ereboglobus sp. PH5-10]
MTANGGAAKDFMIVINMNTDSYGKVKTDTSNMRFQANAGCPKKPSAKNARQAGATFR